MKRPENTYWVSKTGEEIRTHAMSTDHIENTIAMLMRKIMLDDASMDGEIHVIPRQHPQWTKSQSIRDQKKALRLERFREWIAYFRAELDWRAHDMTAELDKPKSRREGSRFPGWKP